MPKKQRNRAPKYPQIQRFAITFSRDGHGVPTYTLNELHENGDCEKLKSCTDSEKMLKFIVGD